MSIPIFCPSKDRAAQLHLLLESIERNAPGLFKPTVLYKASSEAFRDGYNKCMEKFPSVRWICEYDSCQQFYHFLRENYRPEQFECRCCCHSDNTVMHCIPCCYPQVELDNVVGLFTDDTVFYRQTTFNESIINHVLKYENVWGIHLRLGKNITIADYVTGKQCPQPQLFYLHIKRNYLIWNWRFTGKFDSYFAFPTTFDGGLYRAKDLLWLANDKEFPGIINWENMICNNGRDGLTSKDKLVAPLHSEVVTMQVNSTHNRGLYTNGTFNISLANLNAAYLQGYKINLDAIDFTDVNCCHTETPFYLIKEN